MQDQIRPRDLPGLLDRLPAGITTLSLDCFDTLLWRAVHAPRDIFAGIAMPGGGVELRCWAEQAAHRRAVSDEDRHEILLAEVYRRLRPRADDTAVAEAVAAELALEARHCFAFAPTVALIHAAKCRGLKVVLVSDMYMREAELRALLAAAAGPELLGWIDHVFVSGDHKVGKGRGLFDVVLETLGLRADQVAHLGDNLAADYHAPQRAGILAFHLVQFDAEAEQRLRLEAAAAMMIDPDARVRRPVMQLHRAQVALRCESDAAFALGHDVLGPSLHAFALWTKAQADTLSASLGRPVRPLFMLRDGWLPFRCFETLFPEAGARAIEISRFAAARAGLVDRAALAEHVAEWIDRVPLETLGRQLMLGGHEIARFLKLKGDARRAALRKAVLGPELSRKILARATAFGAKLEAHLRAAGVAHGDAVMLVDIGYNGSVQNMVTPLLEARMGLVVAGRYLLLREEQVSGLDKAGMIDAETHDFRTLHALTTCVGMVEQLCTVGQGSTVDYAVDGAPIREASDLKAAQSEARDRIQQGCLAFVAADGAGFHRAPASDDLSARVRAASASLARLMFLPTAAEVTLFARFEHDVNLGTGKLVRLLDAEEAARGLRHGGAAAINSVARMHGPAELQAHGLPLNLSLFATMRLGLDLRAGDFAVGGVEVPVIFADATDQTQVMLEALPTAEGYYRLVVPVGAGRLTVGIRLGQLCECVQIEDAYFLAVARIDDPAAEDAIPAQLIREGLRELAPDLYAADPAGIAIVPPPALHGHDALALSLIFRPVRWRKAEAQAARLAA
ncbi:HAD family hydrolase [Sphingomonas bacterium]|uniref:HAD family hydrolase n=1 Tax=Sphingomonas bacterium TaxID=1895847 RepID=UPI0015766F44|nr:HAD family hydrolase [Sphingomonas bacterium]